MGKSKEANIWDRLLGDLCKASNLTSHCKNVFSEEQENNMVRKIDLILRMLGALKDDDTH